MTRHRRWITAMVCMAVLGLAACGSDSDESAGGGGGGAQAERVTIRLAASTQSGGYPTPFAAVRGPG